MTLRMTPDLVKAILAGGIDAARAAVEKIDILPGGEEWKRGYVDGLRDAARMVRDGEIPEEIVP
jgi:hypothetical protein